MTTLLRSDAITRSAPENARLRRRWKRQNKKSPAIMGKGDGNDPYYGAALGKIWVRRDASANDDGDIGQTLPEQVFCGSSNYFAYDGARCWLELDPNGQWQIHSADNQDAKAAGLHTGSLNNGNPTSKWFRLRNATRLVCLPVGTSDNPSTLVGIRGNTYIDNYGDFNRFVATGLGATKLDLAPYIPGAGLHAIVVVWLKTTDNTVTATSSTAQANTADLDETDFQEAYDAQPAEGIPIQSFILGDAQTSVTLADRAQDLRTFVNTPQALGFPNPIDKNAILRDGRTERVCDDITVTANLEIAGDLTVNSIDVSGGGGIELNGGSLTISSCDAISGIKPAIVEIDDTDSPYTATNDSIDITIVCDTSGGDIEIDLPQIADSLNQRYSVVNVGTGTVTIDPNSSETIIGQTTLSVNFQYDAPRMVATSTEWVLI